MGSSQQKGPRKERQTLCRCGRKLSPTPFPAKQTVRERKRLICSVSRVLCKPSMVACTGKANISFSYYTCFRITFPNL